MITEQIEKDLLCAFSERGKFMVCSILKVKKGKKGEEKTYLKAKILSSKGKEFVFAIKPLFLSPKAYATLMTLIDEDEK